MRDDFAVFVLSHGRADLVRTCDTLTRCGYTGKIYIIVDDEDKSLQEYRNKFGDNVIVFSKSESAKNCDTCDSIESRNVVLFARNTCHKIAYNLGLTYFLELDDDYTEFRSRYVDSSGKFRSRYVRDIDSIIDCVIKFLDESGACTVAFAQTGDFIGGTGSRVWQTKLSRKAMNSFFCRTDRPFDFVGRINEDTTAYTVHGTRGKLFFTIADISLDQCTTQAFHGGLTDAYLSSGTYVKSFYSVMNSPSCVKVSAMGCSDRRFHHLVDWEHCVPKIISSDFKKY